MKAFPHGRDGRRHGVGWLGAGRVLAGVATALVLIALGLSGLRSNVLGIRQWPGISDEAARTQLVPDRIPLLTAARDVVPNGRGEKTRAAQSVAAAPQPTSPSASATPLPTVAVGGDVVVSVPGQEVSVAPEPGTANLRDTDGDGLSDREESRLGTDPNRRDTDGDGLPDGWEIKFGLNPRLDLDAIRDPDRDGVDNRNEFLTRSNPHAADTNDDGVIDGRDDPDGDGLPTAVEQDLGLDPAKADTPVAQREPTRGVQDAASPGPTDDVLVAAHGAGSTDAPATTDGALDSDGDGIPNAVELRLGTDPGSFMTNGLSDATADADGDGLPNALEIVLGLDPGAADSDGDGMPDAREDSDGDGLPNSLELAVALNPSKVDSDGDGTPDSEVDSDGDGMSNAAELAAGRDPATPDPAPVAVTDPTAPSEPVMPGAPAPPAPTPPTEPAPAPPTEPTPPVDTQPPAPPADIPAPPAP